MYLSPKHPEPLPYAPIWRRLLAIVYDALILLAVSMAYGAIVMVVHIFAMGTVLEENQRVFTSPLIPMGWIITLIGFYVLFWIKAGQTVGMRAWRLTIIGENNALPTLKHAVIRGVVSPVLVISGIAYLWKWVDSNGLCLHDKLSKTKVLLEPKRKKKKKK